MQMSLTVVLAGSFAIAACTRAPITPKRRPTDPGGVFRDCTECPRMVVIPAGSFVIGSPETEPKHHKSEGPQRNVQLATFAVSELETTRGQYAVFAQDTDRPIAGGCDTDGGKRDGTWETDASASWRNPGFEQASDHPVVCVSWQDAKDYAEWLSRKTGHTYRLLSDSEWEYAARAGTTFAYFWGEHRDLGCGYANGCDQSLQRAMPPSWPGIFAGCDDGSVFTAPAGRYQPNAFGLFDMIGNAWEWVEDCHEPSYESLPIHGEPRTAASCPAHDVRGGSWDDDPAELRSATRHHVPATVRRDDLGFRLARDLDH